jgi:hypothetical protein
MSPDNPNLNKLVDDLDASVRLANILSDTIKKRSVWAEQLGLPPLHTLGDVVRWSELDFLRLKHMGKRMLSELVNLLEQEGLSLRSDKPSKPKDPDPSIDETSEDPDDLQTVERVVRQLRLLRPNIQVRVLRAACTLLGHDAVFLDPSVTLESIESQLKNLKENL